MAKDLSKCIRSVFSLTFVVEIEGIDVFHDCYEGWIDLGIGLVQGMKLHYQLVPGGQTYDADILIWPHTAKIWCGNQCGWVRTWFYLQRRWLAFSIRHIFPVRVADFRDHVATVTPHVGQANFSSNAKSDKSIEVYLPKLSFGVRRQFAPVIEEEEPLRAFIRSLIWSCVESHIPISYCDGLFDVPTPVTDKRHQDAALHYVQETILNPRPPALKRNSRNEQQRSTTKTRDKKKVEPETIKFEIRLSGDAIIAGTGRITPFETYGDRPPGLGEMIVLISTANLPAVDDLPVVFVNIDRLVDIPINDLKKQNITEIYTKWSMADEEHCSERRALNKDAEINFNDHHSLPLPPDLVAVLMAKFQEDFYRIELRGIRTPPSNKKPTLFGYEKEDNEFGINKPPKEPNQDTDVLIAITKIDATELAVAVNTFLKAEFPIYPPETTVSQLERSGISTNDINLIGKSLMPNLLVSAGVILRAQMTMEVSIGLVGCKPRKLQRSYSRLFCLVEDSEAVMSVLRHITEINERVVETGVKDDLLTGFALDVGHTVFLYVEGPRDGQILRVWEMTEDFYPSMKPVFSTSAKYYSRLYPELLMAAMPFNILKMFAPLSVVLACPPLYARPALPLPTRSALLKIGRLITNKLLFTPTSMDMPTTMELKSFRLELCVAPRPPLVVLSLQESIPKHTLESSTITRNRSSSGQSAQRINFENTSLSKKNSLQK